MIVAEPAIRRGALAERFPEWLAQTLPAAFDAATALYAQRPLLITEQEEYSYREVQLWSRRLASGLVACGIRPGNNVAVVMANHAAFVALKLAIARVGAAAVPINYNLRATELLYVIDQSQAVMLVTMARLRDHDYLADLDAIAPGWRHGTTPALPRLANILVHDATELAGLAARATPESDALLIQLEAQGDPHAVSDILYTSGTTGEPKGVMLTHDMLLRAAFCSAYHRAFEDGRRIVHALPMYHVFGYVECLIASTFVGGAIVSHLAFDPAEFLDSAERHRATDMICVPTMTMKLLELAETRRFNAPHLICVFNSGGINPATIWGDIRRLLSPAEIHTAYGMTETTASTTCTLPEGPDERLLNSNGCFKLAHVAGDPEANGFSAFYRALDPETGEEVAPGAIGELVVRGPIVTKGYFNKPAETTAALTADGWLKTGDLGRIDADGYLLLTGRIKESYRCGGEMVMPREIEAMVETHPLVADALVVGLPDTKMGEVGCLCIVPRGSQRPAPEDLIALCAARLARFKVPRHVVFFAAAEIPRTATGRAQKMILAEMARERLPTFGGPDARKLEGVATADSTRRRAHS